MITKTYNPSVLEVAFIKALEEMGSAIDAKIADNTIVGVKAHPEKDNPDVIFKFEDKDGDKHELVVKVIQRNDEDVN